MEDQTRKEEGAGKGSISEKNEQHGVACWGGEETGFQSPPTSVGSATLHKPLSLSEPHFPRTGHLSGTSPFPSFPSPFSQFYESNVEKDLIVSPVGLPF